MSKEHSRKRRELTVKDYVEGIKRNDRAILARAITLIESNATKHFPIAQDVVTEIMPLTGKSIRIGITGVPGAGKSTFIEAFGMMLCSLGHQVAVLAIDPSSSLSYGSILGDKTRMERLSIHPQAYVRPSPSGGTLGGVARKTRETLFLCEAAGYDIIIVETVGVGQSEINVRSMVDCFLIIMLTGAGDELQGMKKGIMEMIDVMLINKADGENKRAAERAKVELNRMLHIIPAVTEGWEAQAQTVSALTEVGINECWETICEFVEHTKGTNQFERRRSEQAKNWLHSLLEEHLLSRFYGSKVVKETLPQRQIDVLNGQASATKAALAIIKDFEKEFEQLGTSQSK